MGGCGSGGAYRAGGTQFCRCTWLRPWQVLFFRVLRMVWWISHKNLDHGVTTAWSVRLSDCSLEMVCPEDSLGVPDGFQILNIESERWTSRKTGYLQPWPELWWLSFQRVWWNSSGWTIHHVSSSCPCISWTRIPTSMIPTLVFRAIFSHWYRSSLAVSKKINAEFDSSSITKLSEVMGLLCVLLEVTCSCRTFRAAAAHGDTISHHNPSCISFQTVFHPSQRTLGTLSGLIWGGGGMLRNAPLGTAIKYSVGWAGKGIHEGERKDSFRRSVYWKGQTATIKGNNL